MIIALVLARQIGNVCDFESVKQMKSVRDSQISNSNKFVMKFILIKKIIS